jgi:MinD-like ATPase involved in chromosome partitioning or flagellar assembly
VPQIRIPSDRAIPRSINEGIPIVLGQERSSAARAINDLAEIYTDARPEIVAGKVRRRGPIGRLLAGSKA